MSHSPFDPTSAAQSFAAPPEACERFEADLSALVDGALTQLDAERVTRHVEECSGCRGFIDLLATMGRMHRHAQGADTDPEELLSQFDSSEMFGGLTNRLLEDTEQRLSRVLYELGKSLIAAGYDSSPDWRSKVLYEEQPKPISSLNRKGRQMAREHARLVDKAEPRRRGRLPAEKSLFATGESVQGGAAFESGRICLEECLRLRPDYHEARIFLSGYYRKVGRLDRARQQLQIVQRADEAPSRIRMLATHHLSRVYSAAHQFARAIDMEREVLEAARADQHELLQVGALANITIYAVKLGRFEEVEETLSRLVEEFPGRLADIVVPAFQKAREFRRVLQRNPEFLARLATRFPTLFGERS